MDKRINFIQKMDKRHEKTLHQRGHRDDTQTYEKMLAIISQWRVQIKITREYHYIRIKMAKNKER